MGGRTRARDLANDGKNAMASRTAAYGRACYQWAIKRGSLSTNPFHALPLAPVAKRERVLTDEELRSVWEPQRGPARSTRSFECSILTGQRREEVAGMKWGEIAADLSTWSISAARAKNGVAHLVPLRLRRRRSSAPPHTWAATISSFLAFAALSTASRRRKWPWIPRAASRTGACMTFAERWRPAFSGSACGSK